MANCPSCNADVAAGSRWCSICHTNVLNPGIGRLASPGRRLGAYILDLFVPLVALFLIFVVAGDGGRACGLGPPPPLEPGPGGVVSFMAEPPLSPLAPHLSLFQTASIHIERRRTS